MMQEYITITLEEYKELLIIKGKYEELKLKPTFPHTPIVQPLQFGKDAPWREMDLTCDATNTTKINLNDDKNTDAFYQNIIGIDKAV